VILCLKSYNYLITIHSSMREKIKSRPFTLLGCEDYSQGVFKRINLT